MRQAIATFISLGFLGACIAATTWLLTLRLTPESKHSRIYRWLISWSAKGLVCPILLWSLLNVGLSMYLQPFMPQVQAAQKSGGSWVGEYLRVLATGFILVCTPWGARTLACVLWSDSGPAQ